VSTTPEEVAEATVENGSAPLVYDHPAAGTGHLEERLARVTAAMSRVPKRGYNKDQQYKFVSQPDVLDAVRPALAAEGVRFRSELKEMRADEDGRTTAKGVPWVMWRATLDFSFSCRVDDAVEEDTVRWMGWAYDFGDKGGPKAETSALKTFLIQTFLLSAGDDPDESPAAGGETASAARAGAQTGSDSDLRQARHRVLDYNQQLPRGALSQIAKKVAGESRIMSINDLGLLAKVERACERFLEAPAAGAAWLAGEDAPEHQEASGEPEEPVAQRDLSEPMEATPPAEAEAGDEYEEQRAAGLSEEEAAAAEAAAGQPDEPVEGDDPEASKEDDPEEEE
jgi:hypothetical protein